MTVRVPLAAAAAVLAAALPALSGPSSQVAWTLTTVRLVRSGDAARGKKLSKDCVDCHGAAGASDQPEVSDLAGQNPLYTYKQLYDYKAKSRASDVMNDAVSALSERDMADLAAFYAAQRPRRAAGARPKPDTAVEKLVSIGDGTRLIPACNACHGDRGAGSPAFYGMPALRDQKLADLSAQLTAFRSGDRRNDVYGVMRGVARHLTDTEIAGIATYYAGTPAGKTAAASTAGTPENPAAAGKK